MNTRIRFDPTAGLLPLLTAVLFATAAVLASGCAGRTTEKTGPDQYSRSTSVVGRDQGLLDQGREAQAAGRWDEAVENYRKVSANPDAKPELRQEALYDLGLAYSDLLNPTKDYAQAIGALEQLVTDYPDSPLRPRAETQIERVRQLQQKSGK